MSSLFDMTLFGSSSSLVVRKKLSCISCSTPCLPRTVSERDKASEPSPSATIYENFVCLRSYALFSLGSTSFTARSKYLRILIRVKTLISFLYKSLAFLRILSFLDRLHNLEHPYGKMRKAKSKQLGRVRSTIYSGSFF